MLCCYASPPRVSPHRMQTAGACRVCVCVYAVPASIQRSDRELVVAEHGTAQLPCVAAGLPQPTVSWIKDGRLQIDGDTADADARYRLHQSGTLSIADVQV